MFVGITPACLHRSAEGVLYSPTFDDIYHDCAHGNLHAPSGDPAHNVFLRGNNLPSRWAKRGQFVILENGFGCGLNFLATCAAWESDPNRPARLHYLATEKHPFQAHDLQEALKESLKPFTAYSKLATRLCALWPVLTPGFHRLELVSDETKGRIVLTLMLGEAHASLKQINATVDAFFLDGFAPDKNPAMWTPALFSRLRQLAAPDAMLVSRHTDACIHNALSAASFICTPKTVMAGALPILSASVAKKRPSIVTEPKTHAIIIGAGLAGCAMAERLAKRGWDIDLIERHAEPAREGSGNLAGIVRPVLSRDDNFIARFSRAGFLHLHRAWAQLEYQNDRPAYDLSGVLHMAQDAEYEMLQRERDVPNSGSTIQFPASYVQFLDSLMASQHIVGTKDGSDLGSELSSRGRNAGPSLPLGGWWFPQGGWASPPALCNGYLQSAGHQLRTHFGLQVDQLICDTSGAMPCWHALDASGNIMASAPVVILASGAQAAGLHQSQHLPVTAMRGQVSHLPAGTLPTLAHAICGEGYLTPVHQGFHCLGASYSSSKDDDLKTTDHIENLQRLQHILPDCGHTFQPDKLSGRVSFRATTPDRLPLIGALPDMEAAWRTEEQLHTLPRHNGLYGLLGLGSRGLVWASLAAELLASQICAEPHPLERDLVNAVDPARFALRAHRASCSKKG